MAGETRTIPDSLIREIEAQPYAFDFFQAVRRMECSRLDRPGVGLSSRIAEDPIRFGQEPSLAFPPSTINRLVRTSNGAPPRLEVNFIGLLGPNGPMPLFMTEYIRERILHFDDETLARFLDIFHHRMCSLFYRAWASNQATVSADRPDRDRFAVYVGSLIGRGMSSLRNGDTVQEAAKLYFSGHLSCPTKHAEGLRSIIAEYFGLPTDIEQFIGQWIDLPADSLCRLGESPTTGLIGSTAIVGSRLWDCQQKFRIRLGPLGLVDYKRMLPGGRSLPRLRDWVKNYCGSALEWEVQLVLKAAEVPRVQLGTGGMLGWTTWLASRPFERDADDLVLNPFVA